MNELLEILNAVGDDGISDERLAEIRATWTMLGKVLDSAQSQDGLSCTVATEARDFLYGHH